ncbi:M23 family metallopeptidase [uncultured Winogradskyella sp.]|uniref:M23 family metallopeptidase n=1 Tax=uncultured Winogradskyella sp. TaxID=395353 RepID=UPI002612B3A7|nr:M23 family metallopeptidase [uncultured Winogradskyella sp.]
MFRKDYIIVLVLISIFSCKHHTKSDVNNSVTIEVNSNSEVKTNQVIDYKKLISQDSSYISYGFDFPVGRPDANGYYNAQKFQENNHLGDDWNGIGGGNSDLGDPIYAIANGYISEAKDYKGGWGNVVRIVHLYNGMLYESLYAHCDSIIVKQNNFIGKGDKIATIGNCEGTYFAHLHLEIRDSVGLDIGSGYSMNTTGYLNPTKFITKNRN